MHRSRRSAAFLALLLALILVAAACRSDDGDSGKSDGNGTDTVADGPEGQFINPADEECDYKGTQGVNGDTIKVGTVRPTSGPYSIFSTVTTGLEKYFEALNNAGGVKAGDGKTYKIELVKGDDAYDPSKTPAEVKRLVEEEGIFAMVGEIGTETNLAVRDYMNQNCVPSIALATGSPNWGDAAQYPWYIGGLPSYALEAHAFLEYVSEEKPGAKIALLYQNDDFGKAYQATLKKFAGDYDLEVVAEQTYDPNAGGTTEAAVTQLAGSGADTFFVGLGGTACPASLRFVPPSWTPLTWVSITCSGKTALSLAGGRDEGIYSVQATYDPGTPEDQTAPAVVEFFEQGRSVGLTDAELQGGIVAAGWGFGAIFVTALEQTEKVDRATVMNTLYSLDGVTGIGLQREGTSATTNGAEDPWILEDLRVIRREGGAWVGVTDIISYNGQSNEFRG